MDIINSVTTEYNYLSCSFSFGNKICDGINALTAMLSNNFSCVLDNDLFLLVNVSKILINDNIDHTE